MTSPARPAAAAARDPVPEGTVPLRKWYFCANTAAMRGRPFKLLRAAIHSCLRHTDLRPVCLYVGEKAPALRVMRELGVEVIRHRPSLEAELRPAYGDRYETFAGHWLRVDIPRVETDDEFVLYTDIDVVFRSLPPVLDGPELLAVGPERWRTEWQPFNSGVMLMNLPGLRAVDDAFRAQIVERLRGDFTWPTHDQASFNRFFAGRTGRLPLEMNWKPYWGVNPEARIVHYHGPKPSLVDHVARKGMAGVRSGHAFLYELAPSAHAAYARLYETELADRPDPAVRPAGTTRIRRPQDVAAPALPDRAAAAVRSGLHWTGDHARDQAARLRRRLRALRA